ncbi:MAG: prepilin-type N-terminal cleavage/methylation domain-containing protein [Thermoleophilia bacterium]|nr:prepilin-type N-terminal cleavage/methylation domain-containing protein [Thermoleophilia bacterium]
MGSRVHILSSGGFSLTELLLVLVVLGVCLAAGVAALADGMGSAEARGAAQCWQSAAAWAQISVMWQGGAGELIYGRGDCALSHDFDLCGGDLGAVFPGAPVRTNLLRWAVAQKVVVTFGGDLASPDGGGSLYFGRPGAAYRVVVRPVTGLTLRTREAGGR